MTGNQIRVNTVLGSNCPEYAVLLNYMPSDQREADFLKDLNVAIKAGLPKFKVPAYAPSFVTSEKKQVQFIARAFPAVGMSYRQNLQIAKENKLKIGNINHYTLYLATIVLRLVQKLGCPLKDAIKAVCVDSKDLGNYTNAHGTHFKIEKTGNRMIVDFYDLGNTFRIVSRNDRADSYYIVGGDYKSYSNINPLAAKMNYIDSWQSCVGFFII